MRGGIKKEKMEGGVIDIADISLKCCSIKFGRLKCDLGSN